VVDDGYRYAPPVPQHARYVNEGDLVDEPPYDARRYAVSSYR